MRTRHAAYSRIAMSSHSRRKQPLTSAADRTSVDDLAGALETSQVRHTVEMPIQSASSMTPSSCVWCLEVDAACSSNIQHPALPAALASCCGVALSMSWINGFASKLRSTLTLPPRPSIALK
eukprot:CAMPEP_0119513664 /NCGR_PEP_ID=MMETSP1344-20130328/31709_1 /TAXON_ID=236787 /ORGANISM="Florenciella parvula, Strain CCMP2471" /LENGTH=121 /DNA_ID=CAMNT_0007550903 /DNA_START=201 /DNA_END=567 /DNA_ORIENTATION=-